MFDSLDQYTDEFYGFSDLVIENFRWIFIYYFLLCSLVFVAFTSHHLVKLVQKSQETMPIRSRLEPVMRVGALWLIWLRRVARTLKQSCVRLVQS